MSAIAANLSDAERVERAAFLKRLGLSPKGGATVIPLEHEVRKRRPLGLAPAPDSGPDDDDASPRDPPPFHFHFADDKDEAFLANAVSAGFLFSYLDVVGGALIEVHNEGVREFNDLQDRLERKFKDIESARRTEAAELRATIAELRSELSQMRSIQEAARIASRGEQGVAGPRGIPGPPGGGGRAGPRGPKGETGPAAKVAAWEPDTAAFSLTPIYADGKRGVSANLRPFFEQYDASTRDDEDDA
jgi:hypothetical protein